jgi:hypothetical protein
VKRAGSVFLLVVAALLAAMVWFSAATQPFNVQLERERPPHVYDFFSYYRPNAEYAFTRLRQGDLPLWNPSQGLGGPFLATLQTGVLYPPNWLHLTLPPQRAFVWLAFAHVALAAALAGLLARSLGATTLGSVTAGLLYSASLPLWGSVWTPPMLYTAAWVPGLLLAVDDAVERPGARRATALALVVAAMILAGWPHALVMAALAAAITGTASLLLAAWRTRRLPIAALLTLVLGAGAGAMLAAPQLLPSVELLHQSTRAPGAIDASSAGREGALHEPGIFLDDLVQNGLSNGVPGLASPVLALLAVVLAGHGRARAAVLLVVAALALAVSFPNHTPLFDWLRHLPLVGEFRFPFRYRLLSMLALAVCAGLGISRIEVRGGRRALLLATGIATIAVALQGVPMLVHATQIVNVFPHEQLRSTGGLFAPLAAKSEFSKQLAIVRRPDGKGSRSYWRAFGTDKIGQRKGLLAVHDREPLSLATTGRMLTFFEAGDATVEPERVADLQAARLEPYSGDTKLPDDESRAALLDLMSVRFLVVESPPPWLDTRYRRDYEVREAPFVFENPNALPRAWRASRGEAQPADPQAALARLVDPLFDIRTTVLLDPLPPEVATWSAPGEADAETRLERDEPEHVAIRTRGANPAVLVLNDALYPGWEATLDGVATPQLRANTAFRAVLVPAGEHVVEMRYRARSFRRGLALAGVTILLLGVAMNWGRTGPARDQPA